MTDPKLEAVARAIYEAPTIQIDLPFVITPWEKLGNEAKREYLIEAQAAITALREQEKPRTELYEELIFAVAQKFPGETRHETALRYIQQAEAPQDNPPEAYTSPREGE